MIIRYYKCDLCGQKDKIKENVELGELTWKWIAIKRKTYWATHYCPECAEKINKSGKLGLEWKDWMP